MMRSLRRCAPAALLACVWALFVAYSWPGFMTWDSVNQLLQARSGNYGNWHPAVMARLWSLLDALVPGPPLMLIGQTGLFVLGLYGVFRRYLGALGAAVTAAIVFLFPPVFAPLSTIWKDSVMAAVLLCGVAGLSSPSRPRQLAGWLALVAAAALRHNAPVLIVPIAAMLAPYAPRWPAWRRRALGAGLGALVSLAGMAASRAMTRIDEHPFANMIALPDVAGVIARSEAMTDGEVDQLLGRVAVVGGPGGPGIRARLRGLGARDTDYYSLTTGDDRVFERITTGAQSSAMLEAWWRALREHPGTYLAHRFRLWLNVLGWTEVRSIPYIRPGRESPELLAMVGESHSYSWFQRAMASPLGKISRSIMFWPTLYLVLGVGLLGILWRDPLQRGLLIGALGYEVALLFASPGGQEYRYSHWMITCVVIATAVRWLGVIRRHHRPA